MALLRIALTAVCGGVLAVASQAAPPEKRPPQSSAVEEGKEVETLKERLSDKASDEQRVDNCNVPVEKRGTKQRSADCRSRPSEAARK
jgi:hypothetical protein